MKCRRLQHTSLKQHNSKTTNTNQKMKLINYLFIFIYFSFSSFSFSLSSSSSSLFNFNSSQIIQKLQKYNKKQENLSSSSSNINDNKVIILTSSSWNYKDILINWMFQMKLLQINNYLVICYDSFIFKLVGNIERNGYGLLLENCCKSRNYYFWMRHFIAKILLTMNYTVILSDTDCIWLQDFRFNWIQFFYNSSFDMITQLGTYPSYIYNHYGVTICAGFMALFPTTNTKLFYELLLSIIQFLNENNLNYDDQFIINHILGELTVLNNFPNNLYLSSDHFHSKSISNTLSYNIQPFLHYKLNTFNQNNQLNNNNNTNTNINRNNESSFMSNLLLNHSYLRLFHSSSLQFLNLSFFPYSYFPRYYHQSKISTRFTMINSYKLHYEKYCPMVWHSKPPSSSFTTSESSSSSSTSPTILLQIQQLKRIKLFYLDSNYKKIKTFQQLDKYFKLLYVKYSQVRNEQIPRDNSSRCQIIQSIF